MTGMGGAGGSVPCGGDPLTDNDLDGYDETQGDCNDCDPLVNPRSAELPDNNADDDCDGTTDVIVSCDAGIALDTPNPFDAAKAIGLCKFKSQADPDDWGMVLAKWEQMNGSDPPVDQTQYTNYMRGVGIMPDYGANNKARDGSNLLVLSSGTARRVNDPGFVYRNFNKGYGTADDGPANWLTSNTANTLDSAAIEITIAPPKNALSYSFDFAFLAYGWPQYIKTSFDDGFVVYTDPPAFGAKNSNVVFGADGYPVTVSSPLLDACACPNGPPCAAPPTIPVQTYACAHGSTPLVDTPFIADAMDMTWSNGGTGWLHTTAGIAGQLLFKIRFAVADFADGNVDSTVLIDNFRWHAALQPANTEPVPQ